MALTASGKQRQCSAENRGDLENLGGQLRHQERTSGERTCQGTGSIGKNGQT